MRHCLLAVSLASAAAVPAYAEIAVLKNGFTFKIVDRRVEGDIVYMTLKDGGEIGTPESAIRGFAPDEIVEEILEAAAAITPGPSGVVDLRQLATAAAVRHGLDPELVLAVAAVESAFRTDAVSPKGAQGLMQLMPATAQSLGVADPFDPASNLDGGARHLGMLIQMYRGDLRLALAAYNAGQGAVARHGGVPPYRETREYVKKVMKRYKGKKAS